MLIINVQQNEKSSLKRSGLKVAVRCNIDTGDGTNIVAIYTFTKLCPVMFYSTGKTFGIFHVYWTTLPAYGGATIKHFRVGMNKNIWNI